MWKIDRPLPDRIYAAWPEIADDPEVDACIDAVCEDPTGWLVAQDSKRIVGVYKLVDVIELRDNPLRRAARKSRRI